MLRSSGWHGAGPVVLKPTARCARVYATPDYDHGGRDQGSRDGTDRLPGDADGAAGAVDPAHQYAQGGRNPADRVWRPALYRDERAARGAGTAAGGGAGGRVAAQCKVGRVRKTNGGARLVSAARDFVLKFANHDHVTIKGISYEFPPGHIITQFANRLLANQP